MEDYSRHDYENYSETHIECPRCGKHTIVHVGEQSYACLNCGFRRDLGASSTGFPLVVVIAFVLLLLVAMG